MTVPKRTIPATTTPPVASRAGVTLATALCVLLLPWAAAVGFSGIFINVAGACDPDCNYAAFSWGTQVALYLPPLIALIAIILAIARGVRRRRLSWIYPLIAFAIVHIPNQVGQAIARIANHLPWP